MKYRPILFSAPMVRALLAGTKTQTRRIVKLKNQSLPLALGFWEDDDGKCVDKDGPRWSFGHRVPGDPQNMYVHERVTCPYGQPGDRLWVRETTSESEPCFLGGRAQPTVWYRADNNRPMWADCKWTPSIHCARRLSRITLEITGVRVERLQGISEKDALAEGLESMAPAFGHGWQSIAPVSGGWAPPVLAYRELWESINGPDSWDKNPWVWVVEFKRLAP